MSDEPDYERLRICMANLLPAYRTTWTPNDSVGHSCNSRLADPSALFLRALSASASTTATASVPEQGSQSHKATRHASAVLLSSVEIPASTNWLSDASCGLPLTGRFLPRQAPSSKPRQPGSSWALDKAAPLLRLRLLLLRRRLLETLRTRMLKKTGSCTVHISSYHFQLIPASCFSCPGPSEGFPQQA